MPGSSAMIDVRPCGLGDVSRISRLLKASWHATYDAILGERMARRRGQPVYSPVSLALWIAQSKRAFQGTRMLMASRGDEAVGLAMARMDGPEIVLYMLYVDPEQKGQGIGSDLLRAVTDSYAEAKSIRVEVLRANAEAIAWYEAKGFETYGEAENATGMPGIAALYMDKKLTPLTQGR